MESLKARASVVVEEYLKVIYALATGQKTVRAVDVCRWIKSSPSTVHATLSRMQRDQLITIGPKKEIQLTADGWEKAERMTRRHRLVESFLCNTLGISWHEVHEHAHVLEHGLTPLVEERLAEFMGFPKSCPHGTPIPGEGGRLPTNMCYLNDMPAGVEVEVVVIDEVLEETSDVMKFLQDKHIKPGERHRVVEKIKVTRNMVLVSPSGKVTIPFDIAERIGVVPVE